MSKKIDIEELNLDGGKYEVVLGEIEECDDWAFKGATVYIAKWDEVQQDWDYSYNKGIPCVYADPDEAQVKFVACCQFLELCDGNVDIHRLSPPGIDAFVAGRLIGVVDNIPFFYPWSIQDRELHPSLHEWANRIAEFYR